MNNSNFRIVADETERTDSKNGATAKVGHCDQILRWPHFLSLLLRACRSEGSHLNIGEKPKKELCEDEMEEEELDFETVSEQEVEEVEKQK